MLIYEAIGVLNLGLKRVSLLVCYVKSFKQNQLFLVTLKRQLKTSISADSDFYRIST